MKRVRLIRVRLITVLLAVTFCLSGVALGEEIRFQQQPERMPADAGNLMSPAELFPEGREGNIANIIKFGDDTITLDPSLAPAIVRKIAGGINIIRFEDGTEIKLDSTGITLTIGDRVLHFGRGVNLYIRRGDGEENTGYIIRADTHAGSYIIATDGRNIQFTSPSGDTLTLGPEFTGENIDLDRDGSISFDVGGKRYRIGVDSEGNINSIEINTLYWIMHKTTNYVYKNSGGINLGRRGGVNLNLTCNEDGSVIDNKERCRELYLLEC